MTGTPALRGLPAPHLLPFPPLSTRAALPAGEGRGRAVRRGCLQGRVGAPLPAWYPSSPPTPGTPAPAAAPSQPPGGQETGQSPLPPARSLRLGSRSLTPLRGGDGWGARGGAGPSLSSRWRGPAALGGRDRDLAGGPTTAAELFPNFPPGGRTDAEAWAQRWGWTPSVRPRKGSESHLAISLLGPPRPRGPALPPCSLPTACRPATSQRSPAALLPVPVPVGGGRRWAQWDGE